MNTPFTNLILGSFRDQDSLNTIAVDYTGMITWGDGKTSAASFMLTGSTFNVGSFWKVRGSHTYSKSGLYTVKISLHDNGNPLANLTITTTIHVV